MFSSAHAHRYTYAHLRVFAAPFQLHSNMLICLTLLLLVSLRFCNSRNLEWLIAKSEDVVVTGVMVRELPCGPEQWVQTRVADMKRVVGWDDDTQQPTRPRSHGGTREDGAAWEFNNADAGQSTLDRSDSAAWEQYEASISNVIEGAYQSYQRFVFIGKPAGADGPAYFIDFGDLCDPRINEGPEQRRADADKAQSWRRRAVRRVKI